MCRRMTWGNWTTVREFILVSFSTLSYELQALLFLLFLIIYLVTLMGNVLIILVTTADSALQSPMYFFLRNLSFLEIGFNLVIVPKMLGTLILQDKTISFLGCGAQMYFFFFFGAAECCLLATMAYDRYVAICDPLRYPVIMSRRSCAQLTAASWFAGFPVATVQTTWIFSFPFCGPNRVNHFFCDSPPVIALVCADTSLFELEALTATVLFILFPFLLILGSYVRILSTIFRMPSTEGKRKAFSTCSSHLLVVSLFYSTAILMYFRPRSNTSPEHKKMVSLSYTVVTPMLNPIIYSLRNNEVKAALRRIIGRTLSPRKLWLIDLGQNWQGHSVRTKQRTLNSTSFHSFRGRCAPTEVWTLHEDPFENERTWRLQGTAGWLQDWGSKFPGVFMVTSIRILWKMTISYNPSFKFNPEILYPVHFRICFTSFNLSQHTINI